MTTSSTSELLRQLSDVAATSSPDEANARASVCALGHLGRAFAELARIGAETADPVQARRDLVVQELGSACRDVAGQWPAAEGRFVDLAGAAADVIARRSRVMDADERWAVAVALTASTRTVAALAAGFGSYGSVPALRRAVRITEVAEQLVRHDPPIAAARAWLERPLPLPYDAAAVTNATTAMAGLLHALDAEARDRTLTVYAVLAASAAAEAGAEHAASAARALLPAASTSATASVTAWQRCPAGWRVVQAALIRFDDGSRLSSAPPSRTIEAALALSHILPTPSRDPAAATQARFVANQLPELAARVREAVDGWGRSGGLFARARSLARCEDRVGAVLADRVVVAVRPDVEPVVLATRVAARLSAALALELDRSAGRVGQQPQPNLVRGYAQAMPQDRLGRDAQWASGLAARCDALNTTPALTR